MNLSGLGLTLPMAEMIFEMIRKTTSLCTLHMSNNPFIQTVHLDQVHDTIRALKYRASRFVQPSSLLKPVDQKEVLTLTQLMKMKSLRAEELASRDTDSKSLFLLQRVLGHKPDMPGAGQWRIWSKEKVYDPEAEKEWDDPEQAGGRKINDELARPECWQCG